MKRDKFLAGERPQVFLGIPRLKLDKDHRKIITLTFVVKLTDELAERCETKVQRAYADCADPARQIDAVTTRVEIPNTDIELFDLRENAEPIYTLRNVRIERLGLKRVEGEVLLSFAVELLLLSLANLGAFVLQRFGSALWAEFKPSQHALPGLDGEKVLDEFNGAVNGLVGAVKGGIESMTISCGDESVTITQEDAKHMKARAAKAKGKA